MHLERFLLDVIFLVQLYLVMDSFESHVAFARRRVWGSTFLPIWEARPPLRTFDIETRSCARPSGVVVVREIALEGVEDTTPHRAETLTTFRWITRGQRWQQEISMFERKPSAIDILRLW